jgi:hypothetical protein
VRVLALLLMAGWYDIPLKREIFEFTTWAEHYYLDSDCHLEESLVLTKQLMRSDGEEIQTSLEPTRYRLPAVLGGTDVKLWHRGGVLKGRWRLA